MASRSFKPASYLASTQSNRRPSFARTSSSSSTHSRESDDSFIATLRSLSTNTTIAADNKREGEVSDGFGSSSGVSPGWNTPGTTCTTTTSHPQSFDETPSRKRSQPIAIELPPRDRVYTPLSARGDLPGGYFPNHETIQKQYKTHPFSRSRQEPDSEPSSPMSNSSTAPGSPVDTTPKAPNLAFQTPTGVLMHETLTMPMGKYHPSNYKTVSPALSDHSGSRAPTSVPGNFSLPQTKKTKNTPQHTRRTSDVKRKLQQYQRDMIAQARLAGAGAGGTAAQGHKPDSPKLLPLGSPGPITPFELEESAGYLVAGARASGRDLDSEVVSRLIKEEERMFGQSTGARSRDGNGSPVLI